MTNNVNEFKSGFVSVVGRPNAGKSTLINKLMGEKISIVSPKPQTTRNSINCILTGDNYQVVLVDTPGIHAPKNKLGEFMVKSSVDTMSAVDAILYLIDINAGFTKEDEMILENLKNFFLDMGFGHITFSTPEEHDRIIAYTSQLAHVVSNAYIKSPEAQKRRGFSAGSFKDMTRVARLDEKMWTELFLDNPDYLVEQLEILIDNLNEYLDVIKKGDREKLQALLKDGREKKATAGGN